MDTDIDGRCPEVSLAGKIIASIQRAILIWIKYKMPPKLWGYNMWERDFSSYLKKIVD